VPGATRKKNRGRFTSDRSGDCSCDFAVVFAALKAIFAPHEKHLHVSADTRSRYYTETRSASYKGKPLFFGAVLSRKSSVSFHLMPLYWEPALLRAMSPALKKRMQGKSCFNFAALEPALFRELAALTRAGLRHYRTKNLL
jgi:hypothetical protein